MKNFEQRLTGGHPNSLGNTLEVVEEVFADHSLFEELFNCYFSDDEVVRLRTSNAVKRVCKAHKQVLIPYIDRLLTEIAAIDQASTQWTLANLFDLLSIDMSKDQLEQAEALLKNNLAHHQDWIVLNNSMETLGKWAKKDPMLKAWLLPHLQRLAGDTRKSVARRADKLLKIFS
ncbi:MAG: hypothetical protein R8G66_15285 [Cytophagales bacterium]|nr:hypothetical protein [Cytophagales bacterium]